MKRRDTISPTYWRSVLVTLGLVFSLGSIVLLLVNLQAFLQASWVVWVVWSVFFLLGAWLVFQALSASAQRVEKLADQATTHPASIIFLVIAFPMYCLLQYFYSDE